MKKRFYKIALAIYYLIIFKLPNSRYLKISNRIRLFYLCKILKVIPNSENCIVEEGVYISNGKSKVSIGFNTHINEKVFIQSAVIGNYVLVGPNVVFLSNFHETKSIDIPMVLQGMTEDKPVIVEDNVWLGRNVIVMPGCVIGTGSIVGAGAIVTSNIPSYSIAVGIPARVIKKRN